jgi:hypothetical protein
VPRKRRFFTDFRLYPTSSSIPVLKLKEQLVYLIFEVHRDSRSRLAPKYIGALFHVFAAACIRRAAAQEVCRFKVSAWPKKIVKGPGDE